MLRAVASDRRRAGRTNFGGSSGSSGRGRRIGAGRDEIVDHALSGTTRVPEPSGADRLGLRIGDDVRHASFGEGVIIDLRGEGDKTEATVHFADAGQKTLLLSWAPLERVSS